MDIPRAMKYVYYTFMVSTLFGALISAQSGGSSISASLCGIVGSIKTIVGVLAILLFIAGGTLYAGAHMLPAAGNMRGNLQGWSMGMIVGGVVGLILVILAQPILGMISGLGGVTAATCP